MTHCAPKYYLTTWIMVMTHWESQNTHKYTINSVITQYYRSVCLVPRKCNKLKKFHRNQLMSSSSENYSTLQDHSSCIIHSFDLCAQKKQPSKNKMLFWLSFFNWTPFFWDRFKLVFTQKLIPSVNSNAFFLQTLTHAHMSSSWELMVCNVQAAARSCTSPVMRDIQSTELGWVHTIPSSCFLQGMWL